MNFIFKFGLMMTTLSLIRSYTHDEIAKCSLTGVYKTRQTLIESPNYPNNYTPDACWDYVIRSPYKCPTKFHIQFLDFKLEFSNDCKNDYLAIGLQNIDDDMDVLCGQVVGIKKYHTPDGILRLRFFADESPWTTEKGFKLLITRLACEREELLRDLKDDNDTADEDEDDNTAVATPSRSFELPEIELMQIFQNLTGIEQYHTVQLPPIFSFNYPTKLPSPPYAATGTFYVPANTFQSPLSNYPVSNTQNNLKNPCINDNGQQRQLSSAFNYYGAFNGLQLATYPNTLGGSYQPNYLASYIGSNNINRAQVQQAANSGPVNTPRDQYIGSWSSSQSQLRAPDNTIDSLEACCVSAFKQKHFYLSSPGFPRTIFSNILPNLQKRDCVFHLQKSSSNVCRLRLDFKFFDFGQGYQGTGSFAGNIGTPAIQNTKNICHEDYIEIDGQRFCGCRSGYIFTAFWTTAVDKKLRMRMGYSGIPSGGFLLEMIQEQCSETQLASIATERPNDFSLFSTNPNTSNNQLISSPQEQQVLFEKEQKGLYGNLYHTQQQQQYQPQNINTAPYLGNYPFQQSSYFSQTMKQLLNSPGGFPTHLQQQNPPFIPQQQQLKFLPNNNVYPSQFALNYFPYLNPQRGHHNILEQGLPKNPLGLPQIRYARSYSDQQPVTVVETNSTRKEYYYYSDNDSLSANQDSTLQARSGLRDTSSKWDRKNTNVKEENDSFGTVARGSRKCTFDMGDILHLSIDILWINKPICYTPQMNWFTNGVS